PALEQQVTKDPEAREIDDRELEVVGADAKIVQLNPQRLGRVDAGPDQMNSVLEAPTGEIADQRMEFLVISEAKARPKSARLQASLFKLDRRYLSGGRHEAIASG